MKPPLKFRPATLPDAPDVAEIHCRSWQLNYRGDFSDRYLEQEAPAERLSLWRNRLDKPASNMLVELATAGELAVGFSCVLLDHHPEFGHLLDNLHVRPGHYGRGIGEVLFLRALRRVAVLRRAGAPYYLWVLENNVRAIQFYERLGGKPGVREMHQFPGANEVRAVSYHWRATEHHGRSRLIPDL